MAEARIEQNQSNKTKMILAIVLTVITFLSGRLVTPIAVNMGLDDTLIRPIVRALVGVGCMVALGGISWLRFNWKAIRDTWHFSRPLIMINLIFAALALVTIWMQTSRLDELLTSNVLRQLIRVTVLCLFVGINEEAMFRGLMFGGLLAGLGNRKSGALWAAFISSLAFGFIHVAFDLSFDNPLGVIQGLLKTLECGMFGFILCVSVLEGRCILGAMSVHAFFDWVLMAVTALSGREITAEYVSADPQTAISGIIVFALFSLLYTPKTIQAFKRLRSMRLPQYGPFVDAQSAKLSVTAWRDEEAYQKQSHEGEVDAKVGKLRDHKAFNNPYMTTLSTFVTFVLLINVLGIVPAVILGDSLAQKLVSSFISIAVSALLLVRFQMHFRGELTGLYAWSTTGLLMALPTLLLGVWDVMDWGTATFNNPLIVLALALAPGFSEEVVFRIIPGVNWMRVDGGSKGIWTCIIATSAAFALVHALNLFAGAAFSATLFQLFYAFCIGVAMQAVLLRSGSIWPMIIMHTIVDALAFMTMDMATMGVLASEIEFNLQFWAVVVSSVVLLAWGIYLVRPAKHPEMVAMWKQKWSKRQ